MGTTLEDIKNRRSIRSYKQEQIKEEELSAILEAGTFAPSGMGQQSVVMVVVQDNETIAKIEQLNARVLNDPAQKPFYGAPTIVNVLADKSKATGVENGALVIGNLLLAAQALGVGSCYIYRAKEVFERAEGKELLKQWGLNGDYVGIGHVLLGYAEGPAPQPAPRKEGYIVKVQSNSSDSE
ncbi:MAG: nitroreductase family protein [Treponema sp.]|jgi:nitroreductase|nr:nitroreductase family protein [Treponema sp.]